MAGAIYLVKFKCHFSWRAQHVVKFGMIVRARNVVFFNRKCSWRARNVTSVARRVADGRFHGRILLGSFSDPARIILGSFSDRSRIVNDVSAVFEKFLRKFQESICVARVVFGDVGGCHLLFRAL